MPGSYSDPLTLISSTTGVVGTPGIAPGPTPTTGPAPSSSSYSGVLPLWLHNLLLAVTGGGHAIDAAPPVTVAPDGTMTRVPSAIGTDTPYANPPPPAGGGFSGVASGITSGISSGIAGALGSTVSEVEAALPVAGVYVFLALLALLGLWGLLGSAK